MKKYLHLITFVLVLTISGLFFISCNKTYPEDNKRYSLTVFVTDESSVPIQNALVDGIIRKRTDVEGKCSFSDLMKTQVIVFNISAENYQPISLSVTVTGQADQTVTVSLSKKPPYLSVDIDYIDTPEMTSSKTFHIQSNIDWEIESTSDVLSFEPRKGNGSQDVTVSWSFPEEQDNEDLALAEFTIHSSPDTVTIPVRCHIPIRIVNIEVIMPNLVINNQAYAIGRLTFSRKVLLVETLRASYERYELRPVDQYTVDVMIPSVQFRLGRKYDIRVQAESAIDDGITFDETVPIKFYDDEKKIEGSFNSWSLTKDETRIWVSTRYPHRIYELDSRSFSVQHSFDLDWEPGNLQLNQYNNRLYVVDKTHGFIKVLDSSSGQQLKTLGMAGSNILFADNGLGVLITTNSFGSLRWLFIDSRNEDALEQNPLEKKGLDWYEYTFREISLDHSRTKLIGGPLLSNPCLHIIDSNTKAVTRNELDGSYIQHHRIHKEKDLMLFSASFFSLVVYDYVNNNYTFPLFDELRTTTSDFCYGDIFGNDICTYTFSWGGRWMEIFDHSTNTLLYAAYTSIGTVLKDNHDIISFREGDRITIISTNGNDTTYFITFNTSRFSQ